MGFTIPISEEERKTIEPKIEDFVNFINTLPDNAKAYIFMEFVKRNNSEMRRVRGKYLDK